ncbi:dihydroxyacetone kinase [Petrotoga sp. 9PW.55.5.1]|uniref:dihydroxyacetone kinase subunit DhaK n=1 Tax=Petrotoga sp. 9PW.55.5.1 TaxID=1308979 RepID=UPI000DC4C225|nr:dihydroxyacetone kinase subunit DhaK [Petrotoga sp. 9PW.55.5.1]RAO98663.1 dihydroxyacetone kinase [Petrotoga sp. 9PW.55.5.1]
MKKIINNPDNVVNDQVEGFIKCHQEIIEKTTNPRVLKYNKSPVSGKVGIVTGGGSGHLPAFIGYIGENMVDAVAIGEIFSSPTPQAFLDAIIASESGKGVACLFGNYAGDKMNVKLAIKMARAKGIEVRTVVANDDVSSAPKEKKERRRGGGGEILMWKIAGAKSSEGGILDEVIDVAQKTVDNMRSIGVGLFPCTIPAFGKPNFEIEEGKMEIGIGHHGEKGLEIMDLKPSKVIANIMLDKILPDLPFIEGNEVVVMLSGLGATPVEELYILYSNIYNELKDKKIVVYKSYVGNFYTSLDMGGAFLTLLKLDEELKRLVDVNAYSVGLKQF